LGMLCLGMADVLYEWDDLEAAEQHLQDGIALGVPGGYVGMMVNGYTLLARLRQVRGDAQGALDAICQAEQAVQRVNPPRTTLDEVAAYRAWLHLTQGDLEAAARWAQTLEPGSNIGLDTLGEYKLITLTRVRLAQGNRDQAQSLLGRLLQAAETDGRIGKAIELLALQALMRQAGGDGVGALEDLKRALTLAEPEGYVRTFVDQGAPMAELLLWGVERNTWTEPGLAGYVNKLLSHFGLHPPDQAKIPKLESKIAEPLSERELQVLQLVAEGASNHTIAQRLSVTVSTVKAHLRNINSKLEVNSRTQAIARARALRLLP
jgi:ATP/maltotriose-dependent transcriptional regulator MalT